VLGLSPPGPGARADTACLVAIPLLLALAAAGPGLRHASGRRVRTSAGVVFVLDVSRSMNASAGDTGATRLAQAQKAALQLRGAVPDVPAGISSLTTQLLPELFPTPDADTFKQTLSGSLGILKPPAPAFEVVATTFDPLAALRSQGFFTPATRHRAAVFLTDGESGRFSPQAVGAALAGRGGQGGFSRAPQAPVKLIIVRVGTSADRIYDAQGRPDPAYRPDLGAAGIVSQLAKDAGGSAFDVGRLGAATRALRKAVEAGTSNRHAGGVKTTSLALYVALAACLPLAFVVWRRNLAS